MAVTLAALEGGVIFAAVCAILKHRFLPSIFASSSTRSRSSAWAASPECEIDMGWALAGFNTGTPTTAVKNVLVKR